MIKCYPKTIFAGSIMTITLFMVLAVLNLYSFLAPRKLVSGEVLVVEGWLADMDYEMMQAVEIFKNGNYRLLITTGNRFTEGTVNGSNSFSELAKEKIIELGIDEQDIVAVTSPYVKENRTYNSAKGLKNWLAKPKNGVKSIDVVSVGAHAGYSYVLFKQVLGDGIEVGIYSADPRTLYTSKWWTTWDGIRHIFLDLVGYVYAKTYLYQWRMNNM